MFINGKVFRVDTDDVFTLLLPKALCYHHESVFPNKSTILLYAGLEKDNLIYGIKPRHNSVCCSHSLREKYFFGHRKKRLFPYGQAFSRGVSVEQ